MQKYKDPNAKLEAKKYQHPVPSREILVKLITEIGGPINFINLVKELDLRKPMEHEGLRRRLKAMIRDGQIMSDRKNRYSIIENTILVRGHVSAHSDGFGFLVPKDGGKDYYLPVKQMRYVLDGDEIIISVSKSKYLKDQITVKEIVKKVTTITGEVVVSEGELFIKPTNSLINRMISPSNHDTAHLRQGDFVLLELDNHPFVTKYLTGVVTKVLGRPDDKGIELALTMYKYALPIEWPESIAKELPVISEIKPEAHWSNHEDLAFVTIDGSDAKDLDDAVYCEPTKNGWHLYVAIAHVSHYVQPNTAIDREARSRGNSTYFPNHVIPMLPELLSNQLCSLTAESPKAVLIAKMFISKHGKLGSSSFIESTILSKQRLTYQQVASFYDGKDDGITDAAVKQNLLALHDLYVKLIQQRKKRHALDFEFPEAKMVLSPTNDLVSLNLSERTVAHRIIEECMLLANVSAATLAVKEKLPCIFRNHELPDVSRLRFLSNQLRVKGLLEDDLSTNKDFATVINKLQDRDDGKMLQLLLLQTMSQARYSKMCLGHFGLALEQYLHFTSPIRRYPDLMVHRSIVNHLRKKSFDDAGFASIADHCSYTERRSEGAERELSNWYKCIYMKKHLNEVVQGKVSGVNDFGLFISLSNYLMDGFLSINALPDDDYKFDQDKLLLTGELSGKTYNFGDTITVKIAKVNIDTKKIELELA